jgi:hypothetical protein
MDYNIGEVDICDIANINRIFYYPLVLHTASALLVTLNCSAGKPPV